MGLPVKRACRKPKAFFRRLTPRKVPHLYLSHYKSPTVAAAVSRSRFALSNASPTYSGRMRDGETARESIVIINLDMQADVCFAIRKNETLFIAYLIKKSHVQEQFPRSRANAAQRNMICVAAAVASLYAIQLLGVLFV